MLQTKAHIIAQLQTDIHRLEGFKPATSPASKLALGAMQQAFPKGVFPAAAVHEFVSEAEDVAATSGFIMGLMSGVMANQGVTFWISVNRRLFPPALASYGLQPERLIFVDVPKEEDVMPVLYEALKCSAVSAVVAEARNLDFNTSRRLQLAVEQSQATGFIIRHAVPKLNPTACISRWKISSLPSESYDGLPGLGFPKWRVELLRMRNGKTGAWNVQWINGKFGSIEESSAKEDLELEMTPKYFPSSVVQSLNKQRKVG